MPNTDSLEGLGYSERWQALFAPHAAAGLTPARVARSDRGGALVLTATGVSRAKPSVRLLKAAGGPGDLPAVGDWVAVQATGDPDVSLIDAVLPRASVLARGDPGRTSNLQVLAANIDVVFIVHPIDDEPNLRRLERELALAWGSGAVPVVVLTKADLAGDVASAREAVESVAAGVEVLVTSALAAQGLAPLATRLAGHRTAVLIGPSGAGKSTLINGLLGEQRQATREVRLGDGRGRHTTVARELIQLPDGGLLIDTPGLRALTLTGSEAGIAATFPDIDQLALACRFGDCAHADEPDCAVQAAVAAGALPAERLASYHKLVREARLAAARSDTRLRVAAKRREKAFGRAVKAYHKRTGRE